MALAPNEIQAKQLLFPYASKIATKFFVQKKRFVHYCSAAAALSIVENETVWMRNARWMNDFSEMEYGTDRVRAALKTASGERLKLLLQNKSPELGTILDEVTSLFPLIRDETYILCLSEHESSEDDTGRLSMWRAYGGEQDSIALILRRTPFESGLIDVSPVGYLTEGEFNREFSVVVQNLPQAISLLPVSQLRQQLMTAFTFAIMCTKHPGFHEEKEWRLVFRQASGTPSLMVKDNASPKGFPETIFKIPLKNRPDLGVTGIEIPELIDRVIVGPSVQPDKLRQRFIEALSKKGVSHADNKVVASNIPFRRIIMPPHNPA